MKPFEMNCYDTMFHHIYIEKKAYAYPLTNKVLASLNQDTHQQTFIEHYKDLFNRSSQSFHLQKQAPALILAVKEGNLVYEGAPVCQSFGHPYFYYTSCIMNCVYDCEYCYLQGMYPSANLVVFVNTDDIFTKVKELLRKHPVYLCISYDTDLLALEPLLGIVHFWIQLAEQEPNLTIELRTKSANLSSILDTKPNPRFVLAWTVSPEQTVQKYEHRTASLASRLNSIETALSLGYPVRLCFDPMLYTHDWQQQYQQLIETIAARIDFAELSDISLGVFRISADYMSIMRKQRPDSAIVNYPYNNDHGVFHIETGTSRAMIHWMKEQLLQYVPEDKLFVWEET